MDATFLPQTTQAATLDEDAAFRLETNAPKLPMTDGSMDLFRHQRHGTLPFMAKMSLDSQ
jgi:hypothetical protein